MRWGFHAGTVNDARSARELQAIECRLRGTLRRPSRTIIEDVHFMKANKLAGRKQVTSTFSFRAHAARLSDFRVPITGEVRSPVIERAYGNTQESAEAEMYFKRNIMSMKRNLAK